MKFQLYSHRDGVHILANNPEFIDEWNELETTLTEITDEDIKNEHLNNFETRQSASKSINSLIAKRLIAFGWESESPLFQDSDFKSGRWRLDFAKNGKMAVEVAFNHGEATAWNLMKPVLSSELNHIKKGVQTKLGVVVFATKELKKNGNFDNAIGTYETAILYLRAMRNQLTMPIVLIGLNAMDTYKIVDNKASDQVAANYIPI